MRHRNYGNSITIQDFLRAFCFFWLTFSLLLWIFHCRCCFSIVTVNSPLYEPDFPLSSQKIHCHCSGSVVTADSPLYLLDFPLSPRIFCYYYWFSAIIVSASAVPSNFPAYQFIFCDTHGNSYKPSILLIIQKSAPTKWNCSPKKNWSGLTW